MSIIVAKGAQITQCANNNSTSNQMYSFGKGKRFVYYKKAICNSQYNLQTSFINSIKNCNHNAINYGKKYYNNKLKKEDYPKTYFYQESSFGTKRKGSCITFGKPPIKSSNISRMTTCASINGYKDFFQKSSDLDYYNNFGKNGKKFTFKGRSKSVFDVDKLKQDIPGPGKYYNSSTFSCFNSKNNISYYYNGDKVNRFKIYKGNGVPGSNFIGDSNDIGYKANKLFNNNKYNEKYKYSGSISSRFQNRNVSYDNPGPGEYPSPSDFGLYQSKYAKEYYKSGYKLNPIY